MKTKMIMACMLLGLMLPASGARAANGSFDDGSGPGVGVGTDSTSSLPGLWSTENPPGGGGVFRLYSALFTSERFTLLLSPPSGKVRFMNNGTINWTIDADGLGTTTVGGDGFYLNMAGRMHLRHNSDYTSGMWYSYLDNCSPGCTAYNTQFVGAKFHSSVAANDIFGIWNNNAWRFWFKGTGESVNYGNPYWSVPSSAPVLKNEKPFTAGLETVRKIHPVTYQYNGLAGSPNDGRTHVGVVAQELEKVAPYMVQEYVTDRKGVSSDGVVGEIPEKDRIALKTVEGDAFLYLLINSVKELHARNQAIERLICRENPNDPVCVKK